jgi:hypothetical protein
VLVENFEVIARQRFGVPFPEREGALSDPTRVVWGHLGQSIRGNSRPGVEVASLDVYLREVERE